MRGASFEKDYLHRCPHLDVDVVDGEIVRLRILDRKDLRQNVCSFRRRVSSPCLSNLSFTNGGLSDAVCCHDGLEDVRYSDTAVQDQRTYLNRRHCNDGVQRHGCVDGVDVAAIVNAILDEAKWVAKEDGAYSVKRKPTKFSNVCQLREYLLYQKQEIGTKIPSSPRNILNS